MSKSKPALAFLWFAITGCGDVKSNTDASVVTPDVVTVDAAPSTFTVGGTVTGFSGTGLVLQLNGGSDLTIAADGSFNFPVQLGTGAAYAVTVKTSPLCPQRTCTVTAGGTGSVASANVTTVAITCAVPKYRLASVSWGDDAIRVTDDLAAISNAATATPRSIVGAATLLTNSTVDGLSIDAARGLIYVGAEHTVPSTTYGVNVYSPIASATGNIAPARRFTITGETSYEGIEIDSEGDRLYVSSSSGKLLVFSNASAVAAGVATPTASIAITNAGPITYDRQNDRVYISQRSNPPVLHVFDNARTITSASTPTRSITWTSSSSPVALAIDSCRDRFYVANRNVSANGHNIYALAAVSSLTGAIDIEAAAARLVVPDTQVMSMALDTQGALYFWKDSPTQVRIVNAPHLLSGAVTVTPDKSILGVVASGYGLDVSAY